MKVSCLHTASIHIETFNELFKNEADVELIHDVKPTWLEQAMSSGLSQSLTISVREHLMELAARSDVVICTCSSLGAIAEEMDRANIFRIDQPMMQQAASMPPVLLVMCLQSSVVPSSTLLEHSFLAAKVAPNYRTVLVSDAWEHFESGHQDAFASTIADAIRTDLAQHPATGCVVLAQASMSVVVAQLSDIAIPLFSSPELAVKKALEFR